MNCCPAQVLLLLLEPIFLKEPLLLQPGANDPIGRMLSVLQHLQAIEPGQVS
jgi:hypothetical protein